jgi:hypothetical protein
LNPFLGSLYKAYGEDSIATTPFIFFIRSQKNRTQKPGTNNYRERNRGTERWIMKKKERWVRNNEREEARETE